MDILTKTVAAISKTCSKDSQELLDTMKYSYSDIIDDICYNESFCGNEGCMSETELRDNWLGILFENLLALQNQLKAFKKGKSNEEVILVL